MTVTKGVTEMCRDPHYGLTYDVPFLPMRRDAT